MPRVVLLTNPGSGAGEAERVAGLLERSGAEVRSLDLERATEAAALEPERIVVAGGDGSIGCAAEAAARAGVPLAVVPTGTANDFARALGLPDELERAAALALDGERTRRLDLGDASGRPFVNAASAGLSPLAARKAGGLKHMLGPLAYAAGALRAGLGAQSVACDVRLDGATVFAGHAWQVTVGVTGAFGGGAELDADPADERLDVVVVAAGSRARLVANAYGMRAGRLEGQRNVAAARGREVEVALHGDRGGFNVDGELVDAERLRLRVEPRAFELVVG